MVDYGSDLACLDDLDENMSEISGLTCLTQALYRRITTSRTGLIDDPDYGFDVTSLVDCAMTRRQMAIIASQIDGEFMKDERVLRSSTIGAYQSDQGATGRYVATSTVTTADGPFKLVLSVSSVTVDLISVSTQMGG